MIFRKRATQHCTPCTVCEQMIREATAIGFKRSKHANVNTCKQVSIGQGQLNRVGADQMPLMALGWAVIFGVLDPMLRAKYGVKVKSRWRHDPFNTYEMRQTCNDVFVTQYDGHKSGRAGIEEHRDGQDFACVIPLNNICANAGGGTAYSNFADSDGKTPAVVRLGQGFVSAHSACVLHAGVATKATTTSKTAVMRRKEELALQGFPTTGFRYILAGFVKVKPMGVDGAPRYLPLDEITLASARVIRNSEQASDAEIDVKLARLHAGEASEKRNPSKRSPA